MLKESFLTPINVPEPPLHTQIKPKCLLCKKFPVCNIREDYLKTAYLIQQVLGDPQDDRELYCFDGTFKGFPFENSKEIFPSTITVKTINAKEVTGDLFGAKYIDKDTIQCFYKIEGYSVLFQLKWSEEFSRYEVSDGKEIYYGTIFELITESKEGFENNSNLENWRNEKIKQEEETKDSDVINTTFFSAVLNCKFYELEKGLTEAEGYNRLKLWLDKEPVKCGENDQYYHLLTYHIEPKEVPYLESNFSPHPVLYPIFIKKSAPPKHHPPQKREDLVEPF